MIRTGNTRDFLITLKVPGTLATTSNDVAVCPIAGVLKAVTARLLTAGITNTQSVDVFLNGATMLTTGSLLSFATTSKVPTYSTAYTTNPTVVAANDVFSLSVGTLQSTPAVGLAVILTVQRTTDGSQVAATMTDTI